MNRFVKPTLIFGAFSAMALSNAVVPVLTQITPDPAVQEMVFSGYFFGAFLTVFFSGWLSDCFGHAKLMRTGLIGTVLAGAVLFFASASPPAAVVLRVLEGIFTGMFCAASISFINSQENHQELSGLYIALMNIGMVAGLLVSGFAAALHMYAGVLIFTILACIGAACSFGFTDMNFTPAELKAKPVVSALKTYFILWIALALFAGATGAASGLYPALSGFSAETTGIVTALMNIGTAVAAFVLSKIRITRRKKALCLFGMLLGLTLPLIVFSPAGMIVTGVLYGFLGVAALSCLAGTSAPQGIMSGLYSAVQYFGMFSVPFVSGFCLGAGWLAVFVVIGLLCLVCGFLLRFCRSI